MKKALLGRLVLWFFTKCVLCTHHLAKLMRVFFGQAIAADHSFIAGGH